MKKLMKKKVSLMGREFSVFAIAVVAMMALASAALVPYLSDTISGDATVTSPLLLSGDLTTMNNEVIYGGNSLSKVLKIENRANAEVSYSTGFTITGPSGSVWTGTLEEFVEFELVTQSNTYNMKDICSPDTTPSNVLICDLGNDVLSGNSEKTYTINILFHEAIMPGHYDFKARVFTTDTPSTGFIFTA